MKPTVTDANLVLGYYDPGFFLGGRMALDLAAARAAVATVAAPLGLSVEEAAWGVRKVVVENMAGAARVHLVEKGLDPRRYALVGFGGAGPAHACEVARALGMGEVIVPSASGAASALGFLSAPLSFELVRSHPVELAAGFDAAAVNGVLADLEREGRARLVASGVGEAEIRVERTADMRLVGQSHEIAVPLPDEAFGANDLETIRAAFTGVYATRYTAVFDGARLEAVNFRVRCAGPAPALPLHGGPGGDPGDRRKGTRRAWHEAGFVEAVVYDRYALAPGDRLVGPALIEEREATTLVAPGDVVTVDDSLNLRIALASGPAAAAVSDDVPLAEAIRSIEADPIALEIMWSRLVTVAEEMWSTVCRTAFSLVISDAQDFACELLDAGGDPLAHSPRAMPVFNLTMPRAVKALLARYPAETLVPGDVLVTNDPWLCAGHLNDVAVVTPVFRGGRLVGLAATVAHVADIGGTKDPFVAREIYDEGFQIPPMKLHEAGRPNETLLRLLAQNVRGSDQVVGDINALIAANEIGAKRLVAFMEDYGLADLRALTAVVQGLSERAMRDAIRAIPDGAYHGETWACPNGERLRIPLTLTVSGDRIELDFEGAPLQLSQGAFNSTLNYAASAATYPLKCILTPQVRGNAGCYRLFTVKAPEGSILNCRRPAPVSHRTRSGWYIGPSVFRALAGALPARVQAFTGIAVNPRIYGVDGEGRTYSDMLFSGGGQGASARRDGKSSLLWPTSAANTSIEQLEARVPVLVIEKAYVPDSGGPGRFRGGLGQRVRVRKLEEDGQNTLVSFLPDPVEQAGLFGGKPTPVSGGARVLDTEGRVRRDCSMGGLLVLGGTDEIVEIVLAGGSGYGDPRERAREAIAADLRLGLVTREGVARDYGVDTGSRSRSDKAREPESVS